MVYFISGLGADERVFQFLNLDAIEHRFIQWLKPEKKETLSQYAQRLIADQIDVNNEVILIGLSFGGLVAQEIAKFINCNQVIIISSVKSPAEFSWQLKLASKTKIYKVVPDWLLRLGNKLTADYYFGTSNKTESNLLHQIIKDTDPHFLKWAIHKIMNWKKEAIKAPLTHIHGTNDRIFPIKSIKNAIEIPNGGHFMIVNRATKIQALIFELISDSK
ncbi:alpha/beta hydrolase [Pedobacter sp. KR3-3]|uniref:Alpha/beta hydrolase n=1 Tax=Pedobacter albus TaxID=3113905 RepID=A0ABU7I9Z8_9SPHI|nr:alpha/beta hydrolase [Pedobacter sp. KR3-3]MEE1946291.1 alpha/beta hydrolase [Pedobacter sp. KR3-3]